MHVPGRAGIGARELAEWLAYERMEGPLDARRLDYVAAQICQTLVALQTKKGSKPPKLDKFLVQWDQDKPKGSGLEMLYKVIMANKLMGGSDARAAKLGEGEG